MDVEQRSFALVIQKDGICVDQGGATDELPMQILLDEDRQQSDRYMPLPERRVPFLQRVT